MPEKLAYHLYHLFWTGLDWLYPPRCGGCEVQGTRWCVKCAESVEIIQAPNCPVCGMSQESMDMCPRCQNHHPPWDEMRSWAVYGGAIRQAIHRLKYQGDMALGEALAGPLFGILSITGWSVDMIIPVPIGIERMEERGYNQASLIGLPLALNCGIPFVPKAMQKIRETPRQVELSAEIRRQNLKGAFKADPKAVAGKKVLIIDDVTTTGATMEACSQALREEGVQRVYGLTLTRSVMRNNNLKVSPGISSEQ